MSINKKFLRDESGEVFYPEVDKKDFLDFFYPVGTYYETSNTNFNPNVTFGGTWVQDTKGQALVSKSDSGTFSTINANIGSETKTLTVAQLPSHNHSVSITTSTNGNHFHRIGTDSTAGTDKGMVDMFGGYAYKNGSMYVATSTEGAHSHTINGNTGTAGSGTAISIVQPSKVCIRWHRTA